MMTTTHNNFVFFSAYLAEATVMIVDPVHKNDNTASMMIDFLTDGFKSFAIIKMGVIIAYIQLATTALENTGSYTD
jgi:uracil phosphoribosyltransferase